MMPFLDIPENIYGHRKRLLWIIRQIENRNMAGKPKGKTRVLEVGCGTGAMISIPLASLGYRVLGIDNDRKSIDFANSINPCGNAQFMCCDAAELDGVYDVIVLAEVLEHLEDPSRLLEVCHGLLDKWGILLATVPNGYGWFEFEQFLWDRLRLGRVLELLGVPRTINSRKLRLIENYDYWELYPSTLSGSPHVQRFTLGKIRRLLERNGFGVLDMEGSTLAAGKFSNLLLTGFKVPMRMNNRLGTITKPIASGFYLCCDRRAAPVLKAEANICFCPPRYGGAAAQVLQEEFSGLRFEIKAGVSLRQEGMISFLKKFRSFEKAVFFAYDLDVLSNPLLLALIVLWLARRGAYFLDTQARLERVNYRSLLFYYFPSFLLETVSTPVDLFKAWRNVHRLKKGRKTRDYRSERSLW